MTNQPFDQQLANTIGEPYGHATPQIDSDVSIQRDESREDCYLVTPASGRAVSVSATLLSVLAEAVDVQGELNILDALQGLKDAEPDWVAQLERRVQ